MTMKALISGAVLGASLLGCAALAPDSATHTPCNTGVCFIPVKVADCHITGPKSDDVIDVEGQSRNIIWKIDGRFACVHVP